MVINFAETMDTGTAGSVTLTSTGDSRTLSAGVWSGNTFTIPYIGLAYGTEYTVAATGFKNSSNADVAVSSHSFTTASDSGAPTVSAVTPSGTDINNSGNIVITFSETMDETAGTVSLDGGGTYLSGGSWSADAKTYTIPYSNIAYSTEHTVTIAGFKDEAGTEMTLDSSHLFTTHNTPDAITCDLYYGNITVSGDTLAYYDNTSTQVSQTIKTYDNIIITQSNNTTATANTITVSEETTTQITLSGVNITAGAPFCVDGYSANVTLNLLLTGNNTLTATTEERPALYVSYYSTLNILECDGSLTATGATKGAGIGGFETCGIINIYGGTIIASGGTNGAGIGMSYSALNDQGAGREVNVYGGDITANGGTSATGIGGAMSKVSISGGTITAKGGSSGAGIGSNQEGNLANISISGGTITATGGEDGAGIGSSYCGTVGSIEISGGTIIANASVPSRGAAIGGGYGASGGSIKISGGNVTANGDYQGGAVIGSGADRGGCTVEISGGFVKTYIDSNRAASIGSAYFCGGSTVIISGGTVLTDTYNNENGLLGDGVSYGGIPSTVTISGGSVKAASLSTVTSDGTTPAYNTIIGGLPASTAVTYEIDHYSGDSSDAGKTYAGSNPCVTDSGGNIYLWLPANTAKHTTVVAKDESVTASGYYAASGYVAAGVNSFTESTKSLSYTRASSSALPDSYLMNVGQTHTFYAVAENCMYRGAVWISSNPAVATVSQDGDGIVTTVGEGVTTISAISYDGGFTDSFVLTVDTTAPGGYAVSINDSDGVYINKADVTANADFSFTISGAEVGSTLSYTVNKSTYSYSNINHQWEESSPVLYKSDSIAITSATQSVSIDTLDTDGSMDGKYYLSVTLTDTAGNTGIAVTDSIIVDTTPTSNDYVGFITYGSSDNVVYSGNADKVMANWVTSDIYMEYNAVFNYTLTSKNGGSPVSGSIAMTEENLIPPASDFCFYVDMSALPDGYFDILYSFTDRAGNTSAEYTQTYHKDVSIPDCDLDFEQTAINSSNQATASFKLDNITEALYDGCYYTISDGTNSVGPIFPNYAKFDSAPASSAIKSGIDLSLLSDGILTLTVKVTDGYYNYITKTATIIKDTVAPTVTLPAVTASATGIGLSFSETVTAVEGKTVSVSDGTDTYTYTIASADNYISGEGSACKAVIPLTVFVYDSDTLTLDSSKTYTVTVSEGAYMDTAGNELAATSLSMNVSALPTLVSITTPAAIAGIANGTAKTASALGLPSNVILVTDDGNVSASVTWDIASCSYDASSTHAQTFTVSGTVTLPEGVVNTNSVSLATSVNVTVNAAVSTDKTLVSVTAPTAIAGIANGTAKDASALGLPATVILVTDDGNVSANVTWEVDFCSYDASSTSAQTFTVNGTVTLPEGVVNTNSVSLATSVNVTVNAAVSSDKTLVSITSPTAIAGIANGTAKDASALGLPATVILVTDDGNVSANVTWDVDSCSYDASSTHAQTFTVSGTVTLPEGVVNTNSVSLATSVNVTVNAASVTYAEISPVTSSFDSNPANQADVLTTITWGDATGITDVKAGGSSIGTGNYNISANTLTIRKEYLAAQATGSLPLTVEFNAGDAATLTISITDTTPPVISPASRNYDLNSPADVTTAITWNSVASVTDVVYSVSPDTTLYTLDISDYTVFDDTLTISGSFFSGLSLTTGAALEFDITFDTGAAATMTVNVVNNYTPSDDADLNSLSVNGTAVSGFDPDDAEYDVQLPYGATSATVTATASASNAQVSITQASSLPGSAEVIVTAEDGTTTRTYTVNLTIAAPSAFVPVTDIAGVPETATVGADLSLGGIVAPANATNQTIVWNVLSAGTTGAVVTGNTLSATAAGNVTVRAVITNGLTQSADYMQDFTITMTVASITTYTVSFNSNGSVYATKTVNVGRSIGSVDWPSNPARSSYTFGGWFTGENGAGTQFTSGTPVNTTMTVYAKWTYSGGGGGTSSTPSTPAYNSDVKAGDGSETTLPVTVDKDSGNASIDMGAQKLTLSGTVITIPSIPDVDTYSIAIPVPDLSRSDAQGTLTFHTDNGSVTVPSNMLTGVSGSCGSKAAITIGQGDKSALPEDVKAAIGDRPLVQLTLSIDGAQTDWANPSAPVTVSVPYTPTAAELANPENIVVWYIGGSGNLNCVTNGHYDPETGKVTFTTTHFSLFAVGYNGVSYTDVADTAWYYDAVSYLAARGITSGTGDTTFSPNAALTRGQFISLLLRAYGIETDENAEDNFSDAGDTYYAGYLAAAKRLGISNGVGDNRFAPEQAITRQEMFTLLYNVLKVIGQLPQGSSGKTLSDFTDAGQIDSWTTDAMRLLVETGTISGSSGKLAPLSTTTRAEMAQVLYNLLAK